jgi:ATP-dependent helicase Lhr and Lhr-like helicase
MARPRSHRATSGKGGPTSQQAGLTDFLPCVARWFGKTFDRPSPPQELAWPAIHRGENVLLLAPTGSGKTLAAFLCAIDDLWRRSRDGGLAEGVHVLYISPLKALGNDIHKNLLEPMEGIRKAARAKECPVRVAVRTGDTPQSERARMIRHPPHILITTPESLYLLLGSKRMAPNLRTIRTVIVDEVHALCDNKRGVHLSVSLERLEERVDAPLQRVGCSATLSPLEEIAAFLVGHDRAGKRRSCTILNAGMRKDLDVRVVAPLPDFLEAGHNALWSSAYELLHREVAAHDTTLVFCNSRYKAERTALRLDELAGENIRVGVHHGSMSREIRLEAEDDLKAGRLDALVATASLELGIDVGSIDLVYQLESPKSVATGLQRIGRAGHLLERTSKGRVLIFDRDELMEAAAICRAMVAGKIDDIRLPRGCLDVLAQQIAGIVAFRDRDSEELLSLIRRAHPYTGLAREQYESVLAMVAGEHPFEMVMSPPKMILWDRTTGRITAARGSASLCAMNVGTIPETSEYEVVLEASKKRIGKVQSQFVDDCIRVGDVFVLGSTAWKLEGVNRNRLLVTEAPGATPTVPWWTGPIEARTSQVGRWIGELRREISQRLDDPDLNAWLQEHCRLCPNAAAALATYVREQHLAAGFVPDHQRLLVETWRDELGRWNVIIHCPMGEKINRTWGVAIAAGLKAKLRQRWSVTASNDLLLLSRQGDPKHGKKPPDASELIRTARRGELRERIALAAESEAVLGSAFRDAASCSLQILRTLQGRRVPFWLQNYRASELQAAAGKCREYPVVAEVLRSYLEESLDLAGLEELLERIDSGQTELAFQTVESPSPFAHSLLVMDRLQQDGREMGRSRRAHLLRLHRKVLQEVLTTEQMANLLDARAIEQLELRVSHRSETTQARNSDELARVIHDLGDPPADLEIVESLVDGDAVAMLAPLLEEGRVVAFELPDCETSPVRLVAADLWREYHDAYGLGRRGGRLSLLRPRVEDGRLTFEPIAASKAIPSRLRRPIGPEAARAAVIARYLRSRGPVTLYEIANHTGLPRGAIESVLDDLVAAGRAARGVYTSSKPTPQWVNKANLEDIHRRTLGYLRRELAACAPHEVVDFVTRWQHLHPATRLSGLDGLRRVIRQLQGCEAVTGAWEPEIIAGRMTDYRPEMLEKLIASGEVCWRRVADGVKRGRMALCFRKDGPWLARGGEARYDVEAGADVDIAREIRAVRTYFRRVGTAFFDDLLEDLRLDEGAVLRGLWYLAWCGELTCDTYECLRYSNFQVTVSGCYDLGSRPRGLLTDKTKVEGVLKRMAQRGLDARLGRWSATDRLVPPAKPPSQDQVTRRWASQLLLRWGVLTREIVRGEDAAPAWGSLLPDLKRRELLGQVVRGYFIESHTGEQYALPEAVELLRDCRARRGGEEALRYLPDEPVFTITSRDPANLYAQGLEIAEERGTPYPRRVRRGNVVHKLILQAGQVLVYETTQLATLTRRQLSRCVEALRGDGTGKETRAALTEWNDHPIDISPVAGLLWEMGFRFETPTRMASPPRRALKVPAPANDAREFLPYYLEPSPVAYGREWTLGRASAKLRPSLVPLLDILQRELTDNGWETTWNRHGPTFRYRNFGRVRFHMTTGLVYVVFAVPAFREGPERLGFYRHPIVRKPEDVGEEFAARAHEFREQMEALVDRYHARTSGRESPR